MSTIFRDESLREADAHAVNVIFDFDLTLFPAESTLGLAKAAIRNHRQRERLLEFLEPTHARKTTFSSGLNALCNLLTVLLSIKKSTISSYCEQSANQLDPVFITLFRRLKKLDARVYVISCGYREVLSRLAGPLGVDAQSIAANEFVWWRENAIGVRPSALHAIDGKIKVIRRWQASGKLTGPFIMVGDGPADRKVFDQGLAHGFIQANYYRPEANHSLQGNFQVAQTLEQLPSMLYAMLEEMRRIGCP